MKQTNFVFKCWPISDGFKMAEEIAALSILNRTRCIGVIRNLLCMFSIQKKANKQLNKAKSQKYFFDCGSGWEGVRGFED